MDFDNPKVYGDTSTSDGLVLPLIWFSPVRCVLRYLKCIRQYDRSLTGLIPKILVFSSFNILPDILSVLDNIARSRQGNPGMDPFLARVSSLYRPTITSSSKHLTKPQWNFFPLIQAVLNKSKSRFFRIKGHQLHLCFCISVFACFENIFWSACRAQVLTPLTFLPRSCLPRSFPERHNCTVAPKVLYLCFICLYLCILYSCICVFCTDISSLPRTCFVARWMTEKWSVYFCTSWRFTYYIEKKTMPCTKA